MTDTIPTVKSTVEEVAVATEVFATDPNTAIVLYDESKTRLDCLRALKDLERRRARILARLAGIDGGENIPDELVVSILEYVAQGVGDMEWLFPDGDGILQACSAILGTSKAAEALEGHLEQVLVKNNFLATDDVGLTIQVLNPTARDFHQRLREIHNLQLNIFFRCGSWQGSSVWIVESRAVIERCLSAIRSIPKEEFGHFAELKAFNLQLRFSSKPRQQWWNGKFLYSSLNRRDSDDRFVDVFTDLLDALNEMRAEVLQKKGVKLQVTVQQSAHLTKEDGSESDIIDGDMVDIEGKGAEQVLRESYTDRFLPSTRV